MRIAVTIERLDTRRGGAEVGAVRLINGLVARGHEVHLLTEAVLEPLPPGVQVHLIRLPWPTVALRQWTFVRATAAHLRAGSYDASVACGRGLAEDIVWAQNGSHPATVEGAARSYYHQPLMRFLRRHQDAFSAKGWSYRAIERRCFTRPRPPILVAVSHMVAAEYGRHYGLPAENVRVAYYQISLDRFSPESRARYRDETRRRLGLAATDLAVLFVGQNFKRKGLRVLVEAAGHLARRGFSFQILVAGGNERQARPFVPLARRLGCERQIRFLGAQNRIEELYAGADVFCLPTFYDSFGMVALEAMACGVPPIVSRFGGVSEVVQEMENGCLLQGEHDGAELASRIEGLRDAGLRERLGAAGIQTARNLCLQNARNDIALVVESAAQEIVARRGRSDR
jgi:UDP-glucose:(heptosyl)LPS alpha-1,3-glucosyltransferase